MAENTWTRRDLVRCAGAMAVGAFFSVDRRAAAAALPYPRVVLEKGPVGYWRLGDSQGQTIQDLTPYKHHGIVHGDARFTHPGAISHDADGCIVLDGKTTFVEVADSGQFSQPTSGKGLSVEVWMRPDVLVFGSGKESERYVHWLGKGEAGRQEWALRFYSKDSDRPNRISAYIWNASGGLGAGAYIQDAVRPGAWMHIVACYAPGNMNDSEAAVSLYKNGVLRGGPSAHPPQPGSRYKQYQIAPSAGNAALRFGTRDKSSFFTGALDEVAIYPRVLSADEIRENYEAGSSL